MLYMPVFGQKRDLKAGPQGVQSGAHFGELQGLRDCRSGPLKMLGSRTLLRGLENARGSAASLVCE